MKTPVKALIKRSITLLSLTLFFAVQLQAQNILFNSGFESGTENWTYGTWGGPTADFSTSTEYANSGSHSFKTTVTHSDSDTEKVFVRQSGLSLSTSSKYTLTFYLLSSSGNQETFDLSIYSHTNMGGTTWGVAFDQKDLTFDGDGTWKKFEYTFTTSVIAGEPDFDALAVSFGLAKNVTTIYIDDVSLIPEEVATNNPKIYHVDKEGDDSNPGDEDQPFLTIAKAASVAQAGDEVIIHAGTYRETLTPANSGLSGSPITFRAATGEKVIISAMQPLNGWTKDEGSIYKASVDWDLGINNFVINEQNACQLARWPNKTDKDPFALNALRNTGGSGPDVIQNAWLEYSEGIPSFDWSNGGYLFFYCDKAGSGWTSWRAWITNSSANRVYFKLPSNPEWIGGMHPPAWLGDFFLAGVKEALDYANEWYYDSNDQTLYLQTPDGTMPEDGQIQMRKRKVTINLKNKNYISIRNIAVIGGSIEITGSASNNELYGVSSFYGNYTEGVIENFAANEQSINMSGSGNTIEKCEIAFGAASGIRDGGTGNRIINCNIHDFGFLGNYDAPINLRGGQNTVLKNNTIYNGGRDCIQLFNKQSEIAYNDVHHSNRIADDCALIYTVGGPFNTTIHHNWFHDTQSRGSLYKAAGIYLDNDAEAFTVHHNVVWNTEWTNIQINWNGKDIDIFNNTLWNGSEVMGAWHKEGTSFSNVRVWNNLSDDANWEEQADKQNNLTIFNSNPFVNSEAGDFSLKSGTAPIDHGREIEGFTEGYTGTAPDAGAYEFGGTNWEAGIEWNPEKGPAGLGCYGLPGDYCSTRSTDSDEDGIPDAEDDCPNTPPGTVVDNNGCPETGIEEFKDADISFFPNPVNSEWIQLTLPQTNGDEITYKIISMQGSKTIIGKLRQNLFHHEINVSKLAPGYYILILESESLVAGTKFVKL